MMRISILVLVALALSHTAVALSSNKATMFAKQEDETEEPSDFEPTQAQTTETSEDEYTGEGELGNFDSEDGEAQTETEAGKEEAVKAQEADVPAFETEAVETQEAEKPAFQTEAVETQEAKVPAFQTEAQQSEAPSLQAETQAEEASILQKILKSDLRRSGAIFVDICKDQFAGKGSEVTEWIEECLKKRIKDHNEDINKAKNGCTGAHEGFDKCFVDKYFGQACLDDCNLQPRSGHTQCRLLCLQDKAHWTKVLAETEDEAPPQVDIPTIEGIDIEALLKA